MKKRTVTGVASDRLKVLEFGYEDISDRARWGVGRRNLYILHYVLEGKGFFNGAPVKKDQGFLIRPMERSEYHPDTDEPWKYFWVSFSGDEAEEICQKHINADGNGVFGYGFRSAVTSLIGTLFASDEMLSEMNSLSIFFYILSGHEKPRLPLKNRHISEAENYINLNFHRPLSVSEIADAQKISDRYLYNLFVMHEGISPKQYLNELRIKKAKELLENSECSVTEVATSVGFYDVLTFSRFFAKHAGLSPTAFRKVIRKD